MSRALLSRAAKQLRLGFHSKDSIRFRFLGAIHDKFKLNEYYALAFPPMLDQWGRLIISFDDVSTASITEAASAMAICIGRKPPKSEAWDSLNGLTKALISVSRQLAVSLILNIVEPHGLHCHSLLFNVLWTEIVHQNNTLLPAMEIVFDLSENQEIARRAEELKYLEFLISDAGLFVLHPQYVNVEWAVTDIQQYVRYLLDITNQVLFDAFAWNEHTIIINLFAAHWITKLLRSIDTADRWKAFLNSPAVESRVLRNEIISKVVDYLYFSDNAQSDQLWQELLVELNAKSSLHLLEHSQFSLAVDPGNGNSSYNSNSRRYIHFFGIFFDVLHSLDAPDAGKRVAESMYLWFTGNRSEAVQVLNRLVGDIDDSARAPFLDTMHLMDML